MDSPRSLSASSCQLASGGVGWRRSTKGESKMNATAALPVVGIDIANSVFQLAVADGAWRVTEEHRLTRTQMERWFANRAVGLVVMEACGSPPHPGGWGQSARVRGEKLPPPPRALGVAPRPPPINALRGFCREFGIDIAQGARLGVERIERVLADPHSAVPELIRGTMKLLVEEIRLLEARIAQLERELTLVARASGACTRLLTLPGVGLLTATAMVAATSGSVQHFRDARHFASWFGLTPKERSSGNVRHLGRISKRGDRYLRMLLTHGARSVLNAAGRAGQIGKNVDGLPHWALAWQARANHNKAV